MITDDLLELLDFIGERPEDTALWQLLSQRLAEADHIVEARYFLRDYPMIRTSLRMAWPEIAMVRGQARQVSKFAVEMVDALLPRIRRKMIEEVRRKIEPPPLPACVRKLESRKRPALAGSCRRVQM
jgi:hypothetical protein